MRPSSAPAALSTEPVAGGADGVCGDGLGDGEVAGDGDVGHSLDCNVLSPSTTASARSASEASGTPDR